MTTIVENSANQMSLKRVDSQFFFSDANGHIKLTDFGLCTGFRWTHNSKYYQNNGKILNGEINIDEIPLLSE